jgi:hypothetical protein
MAIDQHGDEVLHSLYGRKFGIDKGGHAVGLAGVRVPYEASTAASTLTAYGMSVLSGSTDFWTLGAPPAIGVEKIIINNSSLSTATMSIVRSSSGSGVTFLGSTANGGGGVRINLLNNGAAVTLVGISSAIWAMKATATFGSTPYVSVSTSS